jgi:hypothetical protein
MEKTLQVQYNLIKEGKGDKAYFLKSAYRLFPDMLSPVNTFEDTTRILKNRGVISENIGGLVTIGKKQDWHAIFNENMDKLKEEEDEDEELARLGDEYTKGQEDLHTLPNKGNLKEGKEDPSKEVLDNQKHNFDYKDEKNYDNLFGQEFLKGYYTEMKDPKNADKDVEELRAIVAKNLAKDISYYVKNGQFGVKDLGYTTEAPGLGEPKPAKGKHAPSGYGDIPKYTELKESVLRLVIQDLIKEELNKESIKEEGEKAKKDAIKKRIDREKIMRKKKIKALETLTELEGGEDNDNTKKIKELQSEIKQLEGMAAKLDGKKKVKEAGEKTAMITTQSGETTAVDYKNPDELNKLKDNSDIKGIKTGAGQKVK